MGTKFSEKFKKLWEWYGHVDQAFGLQQFYAWLIGGGIMSTLTFFSHLPWPLIILFGFGVWGIGLCISNQRLWRKRFLGKPPSEKIPNKHISSHDTEQLMPASTVKNTPKRPRPSDYMSGRISSWPPPNVNENNEDKQPNVELISSSSPNPILPNWASVSPTLEFRQDFHKRVEAYDNGSFVGFKTIYWVVVKRQTQTPKTTLACKLKRIEFVSASAEQFDYVYPQNGDIILNSNNGPIGGIELSEQHPEQIYYVVSRVDGSEKIRIEGLSPNDATVAFSHEGNRFLFRIGVEWSGRTFPLKEFLVWVTHEGELKMEFERDL